MFNYDPAQMRLFMCTLLLTLTVICTLGAFYVVYLNMVDMGIATDLPTVMNMGESGVILSGDGSYYLISTDALNDVIVLRRSVDPLTLPHSVRLLIKLAALMGQAV